MFSRVTRPNVDKRILPAAYSGYLASPKKQARRIRIQCVVLHNSTPTDISGGGGILAISKVQVILLFLSSHGIRNPTRYRSRETMSRLQARTQGTERVRPRE